MDFTVNHPALFIVVGLIIAFVVAQSVFFLVRAYRRGLAIGMERKTLNGINGYNFVRTNGTAQFIRVEMVLMQKMAMKV